MKFIAIPSMVVLLCCVTLTMGRAAGQNGQGSGTITSKSPTCPDVSLKGFETIDFTRIAAEK